jgi:hypothetical protein
MFVHVACEATLQKADRPGMDSYPYGTPQCGTRTQREQIYKPVVAKNRAKHLSGDAQRSKHPAGQKLKKQFTGSQACFTWFKDRLFCIMTSSHRTSLSSNAHSDAAKTSASNFRQMALPNSQSILIVGGGQGIGFEAVKTILALSPTTRIVVFDLQFDPNIPQLMREHAKRLLIVQGDVRLLGDRERAVALCEEKIGCVDTLVYTAGVITPLERIERVDIEDLKDAFDVNVFGCVAMVRTVLYPYAMVRVC